MNIKNLDKLIAWIKEDQGKHFKMNKWQSYLDMPSVRAVEYEHCNTAFCLGGWIDQHIQRENGATNETLILNEYPDHFIEIGQNWLNLSSGAIEDLFFMQCSDLDDEESEVLRELFDKLLSEERSAIVINMLENLKVTGKVDWGKFLPADLIEKARSVED